MCGLEANRSVHLFDCYVVLDLNFALSCDYFTGLMHCSTNMKKAQCAISTLCKYALCQTGDIIIDLAYLYM